MYEASRVGANLRELFTFLRVPKALQVTALIPGVVTHLGARKANWSRTLDPIITPQQQLGFNHNLTSRLRGDS